MTVSGKDNLDLNITLKIRNESVERVTKFKYLGCWLNKKCDFVQEVKYRVETVRKPLIRYKSGLCNCELSLQLRLRYMRCYV